MVDTMVDTVATTEARGPLMPNPRLKLMPLLNPRLMLMLGDTTDTVVLMDTDTDTTDIPTVISAKDLLMPKPNPRPNPGDTTAVDTDTADTDMVDTVDTIMVELLKTPLKLPSGSSHSNSFNLATIPSIF